MLEYNGKSKKIRQPLPKKRLKAYDRAMHIHTQLGKFLRVNRSIQAEGMFAMVKEDICFRRFLLRGNVKVEAEWTLMAIACNILKLFHKMSTGRMGTSLTVSTGFLEDSA